MPTPAPRVEDEAEKKGAAGAYPTRRNPFVVSNS